MAPGMPGRRGILAAATGALLVTGVVAVAVTRDGDGPQQLAAGGSEPSTTTLAPTSSAVTTAPAVAGPPSTAAAPTTSTSRPPPPATASTAPTTVPVAPTRPSGQQLETQAGGHAPVAAALAQARARWAAAKPARGYTWRYDNECFCRPRKLEVVVDGGGAVTSVRSLDGSSSEGVQGLTVEGALAELQQAVDRNAASIRVRFDDRLGMPTSYFIDQSRGLADEEHGITLVAFSPRS